MDEFDAMPRLFVRAQGNYLFDSHGRRVFDAVSSIWTTLHGHCHPVIVEAIAKQAAVLDHSTLLGASNPVAEKLADRLCALAALDYAFFSGDGASAVEASLKMALQYWQNAGEPQRTKFVRLTDAYHGDTAGAMSVSGIRMFKAHFGSLTFETRSYDCDPASLNAPDVAAVIVEPIVQAAAGMRIVASERYAPLVGMAPLLIVDEIATGFGRTGTMFAYEQLAIAPDIVCVGKGITGGALALSATLVKRRIYDAFRGTHAELKQFFHGHSYAGNPIACAAALANLEIFEREDTLRRAGSVRSAFERSLHELRSNRAVREVRCAGSMVGIALDPRFATGRAVAGALYERGHFTRPIGEVIQLVAPLSSTLQELTQFTSDLEAILSDSTGEQP